MGKRKNIKANLDVKATDSESSNSENLSQTKSRTEEQFKFNPSFSNPANDKNDSDDSEPASQPQYEPSLQKRIDYQANMALLFLLFYSVLMFTLPFGAFYLTRDLLNKHTDYAYNTITTLSVASCVTTVWLIIAMYAVQAYHEQDVVVPKMNVTKKAKAKKT